jgi:hypothetical protein
MTGVCCFKRVLCGWVLDETFGRWTAGDERKPPEGHRLGIWRGFVALRGFCVVGFLMKPSGGGQRGTSVNLPKVTGWVFGGDLLL